MRILFSPSPGQSLQQCACPRDAESPQLGSSLCYGDQHPPFAGIFFLWDTWGLCSKTSSHGIFDLTKIVSFRNPAKPQTESKYKSMQMQLLQPTLLCARGSEKVHWFCAVIYLGSENTQFHFQVLALNQNAPLCRLPGGSSFAVRLHRTVSLAEWCLLATGHLERFVDAPCQQPRPGHHCPGQDVWPHSGRDHAAVFDVSSGQRKAALSGEEMPRSVISTVPGYPKWQLVVAGCYIRDCYTREEAQAKRGISVFTYPVENWLVTSWDNTEKVWKCLQEHEVKLPKPGHRPCQLKKV